MKRLSNWMQAISTSWVALLTLLVFAAFIIWVLPTQAADAEAVTQGAGSPDSAFYYSAEQLYQEGRQAYIRSRFTFDVVWPLAYVLFLGTWISWAFGRLFEANSLWQRANLVPILGGLFDFLENSAASIVMARYPAETAVIDSLASVFTMIKWVFVQGSFVVLLGGVLFGGGLWLWRKSRGVAK